MTNVLFIDTKNQPHGTVVLNYNGAPEGEFKYFAESYHQTAKEMVTALKADHNFGLYGSPRDDWRAYPIIYLYRHALELVMKAVIIAGDPMLVAKEKESRKNKGLFRIHKLTTLCDKVNDVFKSFGWNWDEWVVNLNIPTNFKDLIVEFDGFDEQSSVFRYPLNTEGDPAFKKSNFRFNLFKFCEILDELFPFFDTAIIAAHEQLKANYEATANAQQLYGENSEYQPDYY